MNVIILLISGLIGPLLASSTTVVVHAGIRAHLHCDVSGVRSSWYLNGESLDWRNPRYRAGNGSISIENTIGMDSGEYTCVVEQQEREINRTTKLVVEDVPAPVRNVEIECQNETVSARVTFHYAETNRDLPAREFLVEYNIDEHAPDHWERYPMATSHLVNATGLVRVTLHPYGNFAIRVIAKNDVGHSAPSYGDQRCRTLSAAPYRNPSKVMVQGTKPGVVAVTWKPMNRREWNGPNFHYVLLYKESDKENSTYKEIMIRSGDRNPVILHTNEAYTKLDVMVKARNNEGDALVRPVVVHGYSGEEKPRTAPTGFQVMKPSADKPSIGIFTWDPYNVTDFKGVLKGFKIRHWYKNGRRAERHQVAFFHPSSTTGTVYNLKPYSENYAQIVAYSGQGDGPACPVLIFRMPEGLSAPVQRLGAFPLSATEIGVVWKAPVEMNGRFKGYNVTWCRVTHKSRYSVDHNSCNTSSLISTISYRILDLAPGTTYRVQVTCLTGAGVGDSNSVDVRTLPEGVPIVPPAKPVTPRLDINYDHVNVTWIPGKFDPDDPRPVGDQCYVEYRQQGREYWTKLTSQDGGNFVFPILDLKPDTSYEIRTVSSLNSNSTLMESRSNIVLVTTGRLQTLISPTVRSNLLKTRNHVLGG